MTKTTIFLISFLFFAQAAIAQLAPAPQTQWSKCYGGKLQDDISSMIEAQDEGFMVVGIAYSKDGTMVTTENKIGWLAKLNKEGSIEWQKSYGNESSDITSITKYPLGGYILCGASCNIGGDVTTNKGYCDFWIVRINDTGKIIWQKSYGGTNGDGATKVVVDRANNIYVGGSSQSYDGDVKNPHIKLPYVGEEMWIIKLDPDGNLIWERSYGGTNDDNFSSMCLAPDNNLIFCGTVSSANGDVVGNHLGFTSMDAWVIKIDSSGAILWQRPCGGSWGDSFRDIAITPDSGCIVVGSTNSYDGDVSGFHSTPDSLKSGSYSWADAWIVKLDKQGKLQWQKCLGGGAGAEDIFCVVVNKDGDYIIQANSHSTDGYLPVDAPYIQRSYLLRLDKQGEIIWKRYVGGTRENYFYSIIIDKDNSIYGAGYTFSRNFDAISNHGYNDGWVMKFYPEILPIKIVANNTLNIYPNPAKEAVYIATQNIKEIRLIDALGRVYINKKIDNTNNAGFTYLPLNYITNGTYMVQAIDIEGVVRTGKLVVLK